MNKVVRILICLGMVASIFSCKKKWPEGLSDHLISIMENYDLYRLEDENTDGQTPLHITAAFGTTQELIVILDNQPGVNVNQQDNYGCTPLLFVIKNCIGNGYCLTEDNNPDGIDNLKNIRILVERGADLNLRTKDGKTALTLAQELCDKFNRLIETSANAQQLQENMAYYQRAEKILNYIRENGGQN